MDLLRTHNHGEKLTLQQQIRLAQDLAEDFWNSLCFKFPDLKIGCSGSLEFDSFSISIGPHVLKKIRAGSN